MDCDETRDRLLDYREGQLDLQRRTRLEAHLLVCEPCLARLRELETLLAALAGTRVPPPLPGAVQRVRVLIGAERARARRRRWTPARPLAAAAALAVVVAGVAAWPVRPRAPAPGMPATTAAPSGAWLEPAIASMAAGADRSSVEAAIGLWWTPLLEREAYDAFVGLAELSEREIAELPARMGE